MTPSVEPRRILTQSGLKDSLKGTLEIRVDTRLARSALGRAQGEPYLPQEVGRPARLKESAVPQSVRIEAAIDEPTRWRLTAHGPAKARARTEVRNVEARWIADSHGKWERVTSKRGTVWQSEHGIQHEVLALSLYPSELAEYYEARVLHIHDSNPELELLPAGATSQLLWPGAEKVIVSLDTRAGILLTTRASLDGVEYAWSRWLELEIGADLDPVLFSPPSGVPVREVVL
jgi:hypothetical protein